MASFPCGVCGRVDQKSHRLHGRDQWLCGMHYARMLRTGTPNAKPKCRVNVYGQYAIITTKSGAEFKIDADMVGLVRGYSWNRVGNGYAQCNDRGQRFKMHRLIMGVTDPSVEVDHIDGDPSNNVRSNLRTCTHAENMRNYKVGATKSGVLGVHPVGNKFAAYIGLGGKRIRLGRFETLVEARNARIVAERLYYGEFAPSVCRTTSNEHQEEHND